MRTENENANTAPTTISDTQIDIFCTLAHCSLPNATLTSCAERAEDARELARQLEGMVIDDRDDGRFDLAGLCRVVLEYVEMARTAHARLQNDVVDRAKEHCQATG